MTRRQLVPQLAAATPISDGTGSLPPRWTSRVVTIATCALRYARASSVDFERAGSLAIFGRLAAIDSLGTHLYDGPLAGRFFLLARVAPARAQFRVRLLRWWPWRYPNEDN